MSVPDAVVNFLLQNLSQVLIYNYHLIADVRGDIVKLQEELRKLKALMNDYEKYNHDSAYLRQMMHEIRSVLFEAEDVVDTYLLHAAVQRVRGWLSKTFHKFTDYPKALRDLGKQIEEIGEKVKKINEEKGKAINLLQYQAMDKLGQAPKPKEAPPVEEEHVVGFDGAAKSMKELLLEGPEKFEAISIVGMLGLGKTTLAKMVFKEKDVDYKFMHQAFVYVSKDYDKREVFLKILSSLKDKNNEVNTMSVEDLQEYLKTKLTGSTYLIVLDDVWEIDDWKKLEGAFPKNDKRCRVLITTRNDKVAEYANETRPFYRLDFLPPEKSAELLRWKVFKNNVCPDELKDYEISIVEKCNGLPLALVVIAGIIWSSRNRVDWWKHVADSVKDFIAKEEQTTKVIELMYQHLPHHLKPCFIYLGIFPEDFEIPVWKLVRLWIAEGLVQQEGDLNLEDMAEQYLEELAYRNLVMVAEKRSNNKIKTCRIHDTLREFCKKEAVEENLFQEIKKDKLEFFSSGNHPSLDQYRRLFINNANISKYISGTPSGKRVRSFLTFVKEEISVEPKLVSRIPKTFKLLRVLEIQSLTFTRFPVDLCNLALLRYIAISSDFSSLPASLSTLFNLQTLIINTTSSTLEIKADIWKMPQFRHLHTNAATSLPSPSTKNQKCEEEALVGKNVQTLCTISPESCKKEVFDRTPKLRKLGIKGTITALFGGSGESSLFGHLRKLESLENLKLLNDDVNSKFDGLPSEKHFPRQLTKLTLSKTLLDWKEMATLGNLENLEVLKLKEYAFQGKLWHTEKGGFRRLKHLYIGRTDLVVWEASVDHFPKLKSLELNGCDKLQAVPHGLGDISSLQLVVLHCTNPQVASSARRLQVLKLEQAKKGSKPNSFKLSVYPPEH